MSQENTEIQQEPEPLKIEKDIPIPPRGAKKRHWLETMKLMEVGDSFLLDSPEQRNIVYLTARKLCVTFEGRSTPDGYRMWRTK